MISYSYGNYNVLTRWSLLPSHINAAASGLPLLLLLLLSWPSAAAIAAASGLAGTASDHAYSSWIDNTGKVVYKY